MQNLLISSDLPADRNEWLNTCSASTLATFFHSPYWAELFSLKTSIATRKICFNDGATVILPMVYQRALKGMLKVYQSMPACTYGGWISNCNLTSDHHRILLNYIKKFNDLSFRENPYDPIIRELEIKNSLEDFTYTIPIADGYEAFLQRTNYSHQKALRKATNAGIEIIIADNSDLWNDYFKLYLKSITRWKTRDIYSGTFYNEMFFEKVRQLDKPLRKLWIAMSNSTPIAGILCFYWNKHAVAWHGAANEDYFNLRPNNLLYNTAINDACTNGFDWFDCNPSGGIPGVIQFKKYMGAIELRSRVINKKSLIRRSSEVISKLVK
jgi:CelD/BcsL family acetyltransferase involved in cellulose biosynthesis